MTEGGPLPHPACNQNISPYKLNHPPRPPRKPPAMSFPLTYRDAMTRLAQLTEPGNPPAIQHQALTVIIRELSPDHPRHQDVLRALAPDPQPQPHLPRSALERRTADRVPPPPGRSRSCSARKPRKPPHRRRRQPRRRGRPLLIPRLRTPSYPRSVAGISTSPAPTPFSSSPQHAIHSHAVPTVPQSPPSLCRGRCITLQRQRRSLPGPHSARLTELTPLDQSPLSPAVQPQSASASRH